MNRHKKALVAPTTKASDVKTFDGNHDMNSNTAVSNVIPFDFRGHNVRVFAIGGEPWFVASDVCRALEVANTTQAMQALDDDERSMFNIGRQGEANIINESGLYTLILRSRDAVKKGSKAHAFRKWVTAEVLPTIRKHGRYIDSDNQMTDLVHTVIGNTGEVVLDRVIEQKGYAVPVGLQRSFKHTMKSRLRSRFNVQKTSLIPSDQMADACNFIVSYALEGEFIPREPNRSTALNINYPVEALAKRRPGMLMPSGAHKSWLDVTLADVGDIRGEGTPCEEILWELARAGYQVEGALCELKTYRTKLQEFQSWVSGMGVLVNEPKRYAVKLEDAA